MALLCFSSAAGLAYVFRQTTNVARFSLATTLDTPAKKGPPENFLLVGIDSAAGINKNDPVNIGRTASQNTDTIMILRVDPGSNKAQLLSLPRDLWVKIADTSYHEKINAALATGGPERLIKTIQQNFGIPINHFVQVDFEAFRSLVDAVGGVPDLLPVARPRRPHRSRRRGQPGCVILNGVQALAYTRSRYFETKQNGKWSYDPTSDLGPHRPPAAVHQAGAQAGHRQGRPQPVRGQRAHRHGPERRDPRQPAHHRRPARPGHPVPQLRPQHTSRCSRRRRPARSPPVAPMS